MCNFKKIHLSLPLPLQHFADYLHRGYYPFSGRHISIYVQQMVNATIENDIPQYAFSPCRQRENSSACSLLWHKSQRQIQGIDKAYVMKDGMKPAMATLFRFRLLECFTDFGSLFCHF